MRYFCDLNQFSKMMMEMFWLALKIASSDTCAIWEQTGSRIHTAVGLNGCAIVRNCRFQSQQATSGGAILLTDFNDIQITDCSVGLFLGILSWRSSRNGMAAQKVVRPDLATIL
jgi:hypothetical protein